MIGRGHNDETLLRHADKRQHRIVISALCEPAIGVALEDGL